MRRTPVWIAAFLLSTSGCLWLESQAVKTKSLPDQKPRSGSGSADPTASSDTSPHEPALPTFDNGPIPKVGAARWQELIPEFTLWAGGLRSASAKVGGPIANFEVVVSHRRIEGGYSLLALLTARLVAEAPRDGGTRPSLHQRIVNLGGDLLVDVSLARTSYKVVVPLGRLSEALTAFADCLEDAPTTAERVDVFRDNLVREVSDKWASRPLDTAVDRVVSIELHGLGDWLARLEDATAVDVGLFHRENYSPERMMISIASDLDPGAGTNSLIAKAFSTWLARKPTALPEVVPLPPPVAGVFWSAAAFEPRVAIVLDLPPPHVGNALPQLVATEYLGGPGGVVERAVRSVDPNLPKLERSVRSDGLRSYLQLEFASTPDRIQAIVAGLKTALADAARRKPGLQDLTAAVNRTRVMLGEHFREPTAIVALAARAGIVGAMPSRVVGTDGKELSANDATKVWRDALHSLDQPELVDLGPTLTGVAARGPLCVVVGGDPATIPDHSFFVEVPGATLPDARREAVTADMLAQEAAAQLYMKLAVKAASGGLPTLRVTGFQATSITRSGRGPEVADIEFFHTDGRFRRMRFVLLSTVEITIGPNGANERCGAEIRRPDPDEVASVLAPLRRHPLLLLSEWTLGRSKYRLVSKREHDGRELAVLERMQDGGEPLRLMIDTETGLIRVVSYHEDRPNGRVYVRDEWRDYRDIGGGMRAPHHRTTFFDDGIHGLVTRWSEIKAIAPTAEMLTPGGPLR